MKITKNNDTNNTEPTVAEVESIQLTKENWGAVCELVGFDQLKLGTVVKGFQNPEDPSDITWQQPGQEQNAVSDDWPICLSMEIDDAVMVAHEGDWIIKKPDGTLDFQTDEAFNSNFEPAENE